MEYKIRVLHAIQSRGSDDYKNVRSCIKNKYLLLLVSVLLGVNSFAQNLTCADFKTGKFYIPAQDEDHHKFHFFINDSATHSFKTIIPERDPNLKRYVITRKKNTQVEWKNDRNNVPTYSILEWIDECSYRLTFNANKREHDKGKKWLNENNGIVIEKIRIKGRCMDYSATMITKDGYKIVQYGTICKK